MKKRFLSILLLVCMLCTLLPTAVFASTTYEIWVGGTQITRDNASGVTGSGISGTVTYDAGTNTLTLDNATITDYTTIYNLFFGIYATKDLNIVLKGNNSIDLIFIDASGDSESGGIRSLSGGIALSGDGSLNIKTGYDECRSIKRQISDISAGKISITDCTVTITPSDILRDFYYGIRATVSLSTENADINIKGGASEIANYGIYVQGPLSIKNSILESNGSSNLNNGSYGIWTNGQISIESATVTANGGESDNGSIGIASNSGSVLIQDATVIANGGPISPYDKRLQGVTYRSEGISISLLKHLDTVTMKNATVSASGRTQALQFNRTSLHLRFSAVTASNYLSGESPIQIPPLRAGDAFNSHFRYAYVKIVPAYEVSYNGNGAQGGSIETQTTSVDMTTIAAANSYVRAGYTFTGWNTASNGTGTSYAAGASVPSQTTWTTLTLYAQWQSDITVPTTYTVDYNANGGTGTVAQQITNVGTETIAAANSYVRAGYTFTGWNSAADGSGTAYAVGSTLPSQATGTATMLYAQWTESTYSVSGSVKDNANNPASNASVKLMRGNAQVGTQNVTTAVDGTFTITDVPNGTYNLVVSKEGITVTTIVVINNGNNMLSSAITLPAGKTNSVVVVTGNETPQIVVGNLDGQFSTTVTENDKGVLASDQEVVTSGGTVELKLTAEKKAENVTPNSNDIRIVAQSSNNTVGIFMDLSVMKTVTTSGGAITVTPLIELNDLIEVMIPLDEILQNKTHYIVYRYHGNAVDSITEIANVVGEKIELIDNNTTLKLTVRKFSTYAIAHTIATPVTPAKSAKSDKSDKSDKSNESGTLGTSSASSASSASGISMNSNMTSSLPTIIVEQKEGGNIVISTDIKTARITPDVGYAIADVIVDGSSVGATEEFTFADNKNQTITVVFVKESALPYYLQNGEKIYIGFSVIAGKIYDYIAPAGETVEFKENPKNFKDNTIEWAKPSIDFVTERELFTGTSQDTFGPNESMTRAMFVTVIGRLYERSYGSIAGKSTFSDVDTSGYYANYVAWANENGIIKGIGNNMFAPDENVTREQMAVIMLKFWEYLNKADFTEKTLAYADRTSISFWAIDGAKYCQETKLIMGRNGGNFAPQESATRAEVAAVIEKFIKLIME